MVVMKVTNNLLAVVLILTTAPPYTGFSVEALDHYCTLLNHKLLDSTEVGIEDRSLE